MQKNLINPRKSLPSEMPQSALNTLRSHLKKGKVYRREDLLISSNAIDRHLKQLVDAGDLEKLSQGLYYVPKLSIFGKLPPKEEDLVKAFLKDEDYLMLSPNIYNSLGLGITQLHNKTVIYNHKRHGVFKLGNRSFEFRLKPRFPKKLDKEFLLIDLLNNLDSLPESIDDVLANIKMTIFNFDTAKLEKYAILYGLGRTKKIVFSLLMD
jgi:hypothetical protein